MGTVTSLSRARAARKARVRIAAERGAMHPALRWVAGDAWYIAHRKGESGRAACGADGALVLAPPGVPLCAQCYPLPASGDA